MTTKKQAEAADETSEWVTRDIETLYDLYIKQGGYAGMTDEEIDLVVEYRAELKHRDADYQERCAQNKALIDAQIEAWQKQAAAAVENLNKLAEQAATPTFITYDGSVANEQ